MVKYIEEVDEYIIKRFYNGKNYPSLYIENIEFEATKNTYKKDKLCAIIKTEDFGSALSMWSAGEFQHTDYLPAILRPQLENILVRGFDETGHSYQSGGLVNQESAKWNPKDKYPDLYHGYLIQATGPILNNCGAFYIPGTAFFIGRSGSKNAGSCGPYDTEKAIITNCYCNRAYRGFNIAVVDAIVDNLQGYALRDYGIKLQSGSNQLGRLHFWGIGAGPAVWFDKDAGGCWGGNIYAENAPIGILMDSAANIIDTVHSHSCYETNIKIMNERNTFKSVDIHVRDKAIGALIYCQFNKILSGGITLYGPQAIGIQISKGGNSGNRFILKDLEIIGTRYITGNPGYEGIGFKSQDTINNSRIEGVHLQNLSVGLDLSNLGMGNYIDFTTSSVSIPFQLPQNIHPSNRIIHNGVSV